MRSVWFRGVGLSACGMLALAMLLTNYGFEAAGSVPDLDGCGFLAGNLASLAMLYPLLAAAVAARALRLLARRYADDADRIVRCGGRIGAGGALLYFGSGVALTWMRSDAAPMTSVLWPVIGLYTLLCWAGGRLGAQRLVRIRPEFAWREGRG